MIVAVISGSVPALWRVRPRRATLRIQITWEFSPWHRRTWEVVSGVWGQRGQAAESLSFHRYRVEPTPHCSELNLTTHRRRRRGEACIAVEMPAQSKSGAVCGGRDRFWIHSDRTAAMVQ